MPPSPSQRYHPSLAVAVATLTLKPSKRENGLSSGPCFPRCLPCQTDGPLLRKRNQTDYWGLEDNALIVSSSRSVGQVGPCQVGLIWRQIGSKLTVTISQNGAKREHCNLLPHDFPTPPCPGTASKQPDRPKGIPRELKPHNSRWGGCPPLPGRGSWQSTSCSSHLTKGATRWAGGALFGRDDEQKRPKEKDLSYRYPNRLGWAIPLISRHFHCQAAVHSWSPVILRSGWSHQRAMPPSARVWGIGAGGISAAGRSHLRLDVADQSSIQSRHNERKHRLGEVTPRK
jgi:hypothetical protein